MSIFGRAGTSATLVCVVLSSAVLMMSVALARGAADDAKPGEVRANKEHGLRVEVPAKLTSVKPQTKQTILHLASKPYALDVRATEQTYDEFLPTARKVIDSFKWTDPEAGDTFKTAKPAPEGSEGN